MERIISHIQVITAPERCLSITLSLNALAHIRHSNAFTVASIVLATQSMSHI